MNVTFTLNGKEITVDYEEGMSTLDILREVCLIKSCKDGCSGQGFCGACTILLESRARMSCRLKPSSIEGKEIITIEGLSVAEKEIISKSLVKEGAIQCGFCTPGITLKIKGFLDKNPISTREDKAKAISSNLCRCTGYQRILDAMETAEEHWQKKYSKITRPPRRNEFFGERYGFKREFIPKNHGVGSSAPRYRGIEMALGKKPFIADMEVEGMLHGALLLSEHPRARIKKINTTQAETACGVARIFTAKDVPG
ncbi:MAG: 2Fe-2S iron-sulfur cluster-binding protein, partial [Candidatus Heimdallarchaeaceae archaeon]